MEKSQMMIMYCLAGLVVKDTGETVENFLSDAAKWAEGEIRQSRAKTPEKAALLAENAKINAEVEEIYKAYPAKCRNRGTSTGKSVKDKVRIFNLLTKEGRTKDELLGIIRDYVRESENAKSYLKNFATFLNNLPERDSPVRNEANSIWQQ